MASASPPPTPSPSAAPPPAPPPEQSPGDDGRVPAIVVQALAAVGAGVGVLGFVILCGGAVIYVRLQKAGLPAVEGVARVPRAVLLATGAEVLVPAALTTLAVVAVLFCADLGLKHRRRGNKRLQDLEALERRMENTQHELDALVTAQYEREREAHGAQETADAARRRAADAPAAEREARIAAAEQQLTTARQAAVNLDLAHAVVAAAEQRLQRQRAELARRRAIEQHERRKGSPMRVAIGGLLLLGLELALLFLVLEPPDPRQFLVLVVTALATALMAFSVFASTQQFAWFGVAAFASIGIVFGMARFYDTRNNPRVAPVAVLRADRQPIAGFLVADTGGTLLLGRGRGGTSGRRMLVMPRSEVRDLVVGEATDPENARVTSLLLLRRLCAQRTADHSGRGRRANGRPRHHLCTLRERQTVKDAWESATKALAAHTSRQATAHHSG